MIERDEYDVRLLDLPASVGGFVTESPDGFTNIYLNARHTKEQQRRSLDHELEHVEHDDLHSAEPVASIEARADLPPLVKARDLVSHGDRSLDSLQPPPPPDDLVPPPEEPPLPISPRQAHVLMNALSDLDRFLFRDDPYDDF